MQRPRPMGLRLPLSELRLTLAVLAIGLLVLTL